MTTPILSESIRFDIQEVVFNNMKTGFGLSLNSLDPIIIVKETIRKYQEQLALIGVYEINGITPMSIEEYQDMVEKYIRR